MSELEIIYFGTHDTCARAVHFFLDASCARRESSSCVGHPPKSTLNFIDVFYVTEASATCTVHLKREICAKVHLALGLYWWR